MAMITTAKNHRNSCWFAVERREAPPRRQALGDGLQRAVDRRPRSAGGAARGRRGGGPPDRASMPSNDVPWPGDRRGGSTSAAARRPRRRAAASSAGAPMRPDGEGERERRSPARGRDGTSRARPASTPGDHPVRRARPVRTAADGEHDRPQPERERAVPGQRRQPDRRHDQQAVSHERRADRRDAAPRPGQRVHGEDDPDVLEQAERALGSRACTPKTLYQSGEHVERARPVQVQEVDVGHLARCTRRGKTSMKPSSIDEPVALYRPRTGSATTASTASDGEHRRATTSRRPTTEHERRRPGTTVDVDVGLSSRSVKRRDGTQLDAADPGHTAYRRGDVGRRADLQWYVDDLIARGVRRVHVLAWRDLDDPDAGGSEVHADEFMRRWADGRARRHAPHVGGGRPAGHRHAATATTWSGGGAATRCSRARSPPSSTRRMGAYDALVEIWNGVPWFSPVWCRTPRITFLHHVHGPMWDQILPGPLAGVRAGARGADRAAVLPPRPDGHAVGRHPRGAARARLPRRPGDGASPTASTRCSRPGGEQDGRTRRSWRSAGWRR